MWHPDTVLVSGGAQGADVLCEQCWTHWGGAVERHAADWQRDGRRAGYLRNLRMVEAGADVCLAFIRNQSRGASHCAAWADLAGIPTTVYAASEKGPSNHECRNALSSRG